MKRTWKNFAAKSAARLLTAALAITACLSGMTIPVHAAGYGKDGVVRDMTSQQIVEDMGLGYNIGNTFDSLGSFIPKGDPWDYQKGWGNEPVSKHFIQKVKAAGFRTIRFPVSWAQWIDDNHQIDPGYMNAVQTVVDWCMEEDMYVILNMHHDSGAGDTSWIRKAATDWEWTSKRYESAWTQIANNFKNYGDHLIFEGMNEVEFPAASNMSRQYEILNSMNQLFVDSVRKTGGNNGTRHLLIPGYNTNIERSCDRRYQMPSDPAGHCILSIHYYSPSPFCVAEHNVDWATPLTTWGTEEDIRAVEADFDILAKNYLSKGIPVIIGEYGVLTEDQKEKSSIQAYVSKVPELILEYGMCPILWDTSNAGDMKFIERVSGDFYDPVIRNNYLALSQKRAAGQITRRQFHYPDYRRVSVPASPEGWVSLAAYEPEKIVGVAFEMACSSDWDSYGGGGIYIDSWDDTIQYQFNSVFDEIVHIFTPEEKARLKDQISVAIWWTDESKGGSRRDEPSLKGGKVTLLYEGGTGNVSRTSGGGSGSGGSGGGSSSRPNHSTDPAGDNGTYDNEVKRFERKITKGANSFPEGADAENYSYRFKVADLCEEFQAGDKVRVTVTTLSDKGYSFGITNGTWSEQSEGSFSSKDKTASWEFIPDGTGEVVIRMYWLEGEYFLYNIAAEVVEKAVRIDPFEITESQSAGGGYEYQLDYDLFRAERGKRVKLTVDVAEPEGKTFAKGKVWFIDENGVRVEGDIGPDSRSMSLRGTPEDGVLMIGDFENPTSARALSEEELGIRLINVKVEELPELPESALAEIQSRGRMVIPSDLVVKEEIEGQEQSGVKIYYQCSDGVTVGDIGGQIVVDNDWDHVFGNETWVTGEDEKGTYIWCEYENAGSVLINCWGTGNGSWTIMSVVYVGDTAKEPEAPVVGENEEMIEADEEGWYPLSSKGKPAGVRFRGTGSGNEWGANLGIDCDPWSIWVNGFKDNQEITYLFEDGEKAYAFTKVKPALETIEYVIFIYSDEEPVNPPSEGPTDLAENEAWIQADEDGKYYNPAGKAAPVGMRFTMTGNDTSGANMNVNGAYWGWKSSGTKLDFEEGTEAEYVELFPKDGSEIEYVIFIYSDGEPVNPPAEGPTDLAENEEWIQADESGKYYNPAGKASPVGMRFTMTGNDTSGANINVNGTWWAWKSSETELNFAEGTDTEYVELFPGDGSEIEYVIFIYSDEETAAMAAEEAVPKRETAASEKTNGDAVIKKDPSESNQNKAVTDSKEKDDGKDAVLIPEEEGKASDLTTGEEKASDLTGKKDESGADDLAVKEDEDLQEDGSQDEVQEETEKTESVSQDQNEILTQPDAQLPEDFEESRESAESGEEKGEEPQEKNSREDDSQEDNGQENNGQEGTDDTGAGEDQPEVVE